MYFTFWALVGGERVQRWEQVGEAVLLPQRSALAQHAVGLCEPLREHQLVVVDPCRVEPAPCH